MGNWEALRLGVELIPENHLKKGVPIYLPVPHLQVAEGYCFQRKVLQVECRVFAESCLRCIEV